MEELFTRKTQENVYVTILEAGQGHLEHRKQFQQTQNNLVELQITLQTLGNWLIHTSHRIT